MGKILEDFQYQVTFLRDLNFEETGNRLSGFYNWLQSNEITKKIIDDLLNEIDLNNILERSELRNPPKASTPKEIAAVGIYFISQCNKNLDTYNLAIQYGISPRFSTNALQDYHDEVMNRYIEPGINYIEREISRKEDEQNEKLQINSYDSILSNHPLEITESLQKFKKDYPDINRNAFIMMRFGKTKAHKSIISAIRNTLKKYGINALKADDKEYNDDLHANILTYIFGCRIGIAVFERLEVEEFNPNVAYEVGYMRALKKSICLLKDKTLRTLQTDLIGKLYRTFDPQDPENSIPEELEKWLRDKDIITN